MLSKNLLVCLCGVTLYNVASLFFYELFYAALEPKYSCSSLESGLQEIISENCRRPESSPLTCTYVRLHLILTGLNVVFKKLSCFFKLVICLIAFSDFRCKSSSVITSYFKLKLLFGYLRFAIVYNMKV